VISLVRAKTREDMLLSANDSAYTLAGSIWTQNLSAAHSIARGLNAGIIWINAHHLNDPSSLWGGWGDSGLGKENGRVAFKESCRETSVIVNLDEKPVGWFSGGKSARYG
jgi:acyl-CoA reductase-like NAD-dependent aldehyde dehydrogenase